MGPAHLRWLFVGNHTTGPASPFDLFADPDIRRVNNTFLWWAVASLAVSALLTGLISWPWWDAIHSSVVNSRARIPKFARILTVIASRACRLEIGRRVTLAADEQRSLSDQGRRAVVHRGW